MVKKEEGETKLLEIFDRSAKNRAAVFNPEGKAGGISGKARLYNYT